MIDVSCALIKGHNGEILATQRSSVMRLPLKWEFPGGKNEPGETAEECVVRELLEELGVMVKIIKRMDPVIHDDGQLVIRLIPFECVILEGEICLTEHAACLWLQPDELSALDWADADLPVVQNYLEGLEKRF
ncbi:MAG TPA: (deoxy)nucleoside triphosphate pyrophosphohydrolase [Pedobacter sp.]